MRKDGWNDLDVIILKKLYPTVDTANLEVLLDKSRKSILNKTSRLNIHKAPIDESDLENKIFELRLKKKLSIEKISFELKISKSVIYRILKKFNLIDI